MVVDVDCGWQGMRDQEKEWSVRREDRRAGAWFALCSSGS